MIKNKSIVKLTFPKEKEFNYINLIDFLSKYNIKILKLAKDRGICINFYEYNQVEPGIFSKFTDCLVEEIWSDTEEVIDKLHVKEHISMNMIYICSTDYYIYYLDLIKYNLVVFSKKGKELVDSRKDLSLLRGSIKKYINDIINKGEETPYFKALNIILRRYFINILNYEK